jgi:hypothetical protein
MHGQRQRISVLSSRKAVEEISKGKKRDTKNSNVKEKKG